jgi:hypothetical protein
MRRLQDRNHVAHRLALGHDVAEDLVIERRHIEFDLGKAGPQAEVTHDLGELHVTDSFFNPVAKPEVLAVRSIDFGSMKKFGWLVAQFTVGKPYSVNQIRFSRGVHVPTAL